MWEKIIKNLEKLRKIVKIKDDKVNVGNFLLMVTQLDVDDFKYGKIELLFIRFSSVENA